MAAYEWRCEECGITKVIGRPMSDYRVPPDDSCKCGKKEWTKLLSSGILVNGNLQKGNYGSGS